MGMLSGWRWAPTVAHDPERTNADTLAQMLAVVAIAFAAKYGLASLWVNLEAMAGNPWAFGFEVGHIAGNLAAGNGFSVSREPGIFIPTAWISPLYPMLLAGIFKTFGLYSLASAKAVLIVNCALQAASAGLLFVMGLRFGGRKVGILAAALFVVNPNGWQFISWAWPSQLFAFALLSHFCALLIPARSHWLSGALSGATFALALMADGAAIAVAPITLAHFFFGYSRDARLTAIAAALLAFAIGVAPWTVRNAQQFGSINPLRGNIGVNLWVGNYPGANAESFHGLAPSPWHDVEQGERFTQLGEQAYDRGARIAALDEISAHPGRFVANTLTRFSGFWIGEWWTSYSHIAWYYSAGLVALFALALRGAVYARSAGTVAIVAALLFFGGPYYLTVHGHGRYRVPIEPLMCILAVMKPPKDFALEPKREQEDVQ